MQIWIFQNKKWFVSSLDANLNFSKSKAVLYLPGVLSQATKNKTYTPKNIYSSVSKDRSHGEYNENNFKEKKKKPKEQFKLKYRNQSKEQTLV